MKRYFSQSKSETAGDTRIRPKRHKRDTTTIPTKDTDDANIFKNVRTGLLNTRAATMEHMDRIWSNRFECLEVNAVLFSKWLASSVSFG